MKETVYTYWQNRSMEDIEGEVWAFVPNTDECYAVSTFGRVKSIIRREYYTYENETLIKHVIPIILKQTLVSTGYLAVSITYSGAKKQKWESVHFLVCSCFKKKDQDKVLVHHIKNVRTLNTIENLMWATVQENSDFQKTEHGNYEVINISKPNDAPLVPRKSLCDKYHTFIYGIKDANNTVVYVGKSDDPVERFRNHRVQAKIKGDDHWLSDLLSGTSKVDFFILKKCLKTEWEFWEKFFISHYRKINPLLFNKANGGTFNIPEHFKREGYKKRKILQYSRKGIFIKEWPSVTDAAIFAKVSTSTLSGSLKFRSLTANSLWIHKSGDSIPLKIEPYKSIVGLPILQYSLEGIFIKEWPNAHTAHLALGCPAAQIYLAIYTKRRWAANSLWRLKECDIIPPTIDVIEKKKTLKSIFSVDADGNRLWWNSIKTASEKLNINKTSINESIRLGIKRKGYLFEKDLSNDRWLNPHGRLR